MFDPTKRLTAPLTLRESPKEAAETETVVKSTQEVLDSVTARLEKFSRGGDGA